MTAGALIPGTAAAIIAGAGQRERLTKNATSAMSRMRTTNGPMKNPTLKAKPCEAFSGHCADGMVSDGANLYSVVVWFAAIEPKSFFADTAMTKKKSLPL